MHLERTDPASAAANPPAARAERPWTGRHVLIAAIAAFSVVIAANATMVYFATSSFPGLVAKNSYVASQNWTRARAAEAELGWSLKLELGPDALWFVAESRAGAPLSDVSVAARAGRPMDARTDADLTLEPVSPGRWRAEPLGPGLWRIEAEITDAKGRTLKRAYRRSGGPAPRG